MADNVGNVNSVNSVAGTLRADGARAANRTVEAYISALCEAYLFYPVRRYDIKGRELLRTGGKHYVVDVGIRNYLQGYRDADQGRVFENLVYLQLLHDGFEVSVGKMRANEVDFVASRAGGRVYMQVSEDMTDPETLERELRPLRCGIRPGRQLRRLPLAGHGIAGSTIGAPGLPAGHAWWPHMAQIGVPAPRRPIIGTIRLVCHSQLPNRRYGVLGHRGVRLEVWDAGEKGRAKAAWAQRQPHASGELGNRGGGVRYALGALTSRT